MPPGCTSPGGSIPVFDQGQSISEAVFWTPPHVASGVYPHRVRPWSPGAWYSLPSLGPPHGRSPGTIAMPKEQTGTNDLFDEALEDFVESRRARLPKNPGTLAASVPKKLKVRESEVGRLPDELSPVPTPSQWLYRRLH